MRAAWLLLLALGAGACLVVQATLNSSLRGALGSWAWAGFVSYAGGTVTMALILLARREPWVAAAARSSWPSAIWMGGFFGALYLVLAILLLPRLGATTLVAGVVAGQLLVSLVFDQFGWLGVPQQPISLARLFGVALLIGGVALIRGQG